MIIPKYWAEARLQHRDRKRQITVRRFGWSDVGEAEAMAGAGADVLVPHMGLTTGGSIGADTAHTPTFGRRASAVRPAASRRAAAFFTASSPRLATTRSGFSLKSA